jgi:hypothetical protein
LYSKDEGTSQKKKDKERSTAKLQTENKKINSENKISAGEDIFHNHPDRPWVPPRLLYNGY